MNLNKTFGRVATTLVAGAMLTALAMPAYAQGEDSEPSKALTTTENTVSFIKKIDMTNAEGANVPNVTFKFNITGGDAADQITDDDTQTAGVQIVKANEGKADTTVNINFKMDQFDAPGEYTYTLQEVATSVPGMTDDTKAYTLKVVVVNTDAEAPDGTYVIDSAVLSNDGTKTDSITDYYATYDLTLNKIVTGDFGNKNTPFSFTISFRSNDSNAVSFTRSDTNEKVNFASGEAQVNVNLKHGESVKFTGLPEGVTYSIVEAENESDKGYTTTVTGDGVNYTGGASEIKAKSVDGDVSVENVAKDVSVQFENNKVSSPATGIVMDVAPYVLLVVVAAAGCFVFLRKRRED